MTETNVTPYTRTTDRFQYYLSDCQYCANFRNRGGHGCGRPRCEFEDIRQDYIAHGRIKRRRGWEIEQCTA